MGLEMDEFIQQCLNEYEALMEDNFFSAQSLSKLEEYHQSVKQQLVSEMPKKWGSLSSGSMSNKIKIKIKFVEAVEETFAELREHFVKSKHREESNKVTVTSPLNQEALKYYTEEMDKYFESHAQATPKEIQMHHSQVTRKAVEQVKTSGGTTISAQTVSGLRAELEERGKVYKTRAEMNLKSMKDPAIGIDLGTTNCCVMVFYQNKIMMIPNRAQGSSSTTPSYVAFHEDGTDTFGKVAKEEGYRYPEVTIYDAKRMIGRTWADDKLQANRKKWPFEVVNDNGHCKLEAWGRSRYPHEVSARLLTRFRIMAEEHLQLAPGTIRKAVITVPAYFTEPQRRATNEAAQCAGLQVLNILSEPTAAAIAYSWERRDSSSATRKALIYDLGGGTFDVAIALVKSDGVEILGVDGDTHLGGQDIDQLMMDYCLKEFKAKEGVDLEALRNSPETRTKFLAKRGICRLKLQCEIAKERLSTSSKSSVEIDNIYKDNDLSVSVTRKKLEELVSPLVKKTLSIVTRTLNDVKGKGVKDKADIDDVILVGGSTRIPILIKMLEEYFGGKQLCMNINPDEAVAYGAAVQAAILNNDENVKRISVQDVTPLPIGIGIGWDLDRFSEMIKKNAKIPCDHKGRYITSRDDQTAITLAVFQGESGLCKDNKELGSFRLEGLPPKPAGEEKIWVKMTIDKSGMLHVEAESISLRNNKNAITIKADRLGMNDVDIERVKQECQLLTISG